MGAPVGNRNAAKSKRWQDALNKALARFTTETIPAGEALDAIAESVVAKAVMGDKDCWQEISNRLDGKVAQAIIGDSDADPIRVISRIERVLVRANADDSDG